MKKTFLSLLAFGLAMGAAAETRYYTTDLLGDNVSVSSNGRFAVIADTQDNLSYVWDSEKPEDFVQVSAPNGNKIELYGVSDNGIAVGGYYLGDGVFKPCIVVDGEIEELPVPVNIKNNNFARCVTADAKTIGGYIAYRDPESEVGMRYRPIFWHRTESGAYEYEFYPEMELPAHQGFIVNCMNPEGTILGGRLYCAAGSEIPAIYKDGKMEYWNQLETVVEPFYYKGKYLYDTEVYYIDGMKDGCKGDYLQGEFVGADAWGNFYGCRTNVDEVSEDGEDYKLSKYALVYNTKTGKSMDYPAEDGIITFSTAVGPQCDYIFCNGDKMLLSEDDEALVKSVSGTFGFSNATAMAAVLSTSATGQVISGTRQEIHPATGEYMYYPFIVVLDNPLCEAPNGSAVEVISENEGCAVILSAGRIDFAGEEGAVFDLNGRFIGAGYTVNIPAGVYVVKVGNATRKVMVK